MAERFKFTLVLKFIRQSPQNVQYTNANININMNTRREFRDTVKRMYQH